MSSLSRIRKLRAEKAFLFFFSPVVSILFCFSFFIIIIIIIILKKRGALRTWGEEINKSVSLFEERGFLEFGFLCKKKKGDDRLIELTTYSMSSAG